MGHCIKPRPQGGRRQHAQGSVRSEALMGTSGSYGGPAPGSPLVPTWVDPIGSPPIGPGLPPPDIAQPDGVPSPTVPAAPSARPNPQPAPAGNFTVPRSNFTRYARSGGNDRTSLGRAVSSYVSSGTGGARRAAQRMGSSRGTTARLCKLSIRRQQPWRSGGASVPKPRSPRRQTDRGNLPRARRFHLPGRGNGGRRDRP